MSGSSFERRLRDPIRRAAGDLSEYHPGCPIQGVTYATIDGDTYCGHENHRRVREIQNLAAEQLSDDRPFIQHSSDGRTATTRVGSTWVQYMPSDPGGTESQSLWPEPDEAQRSISAAIDSMFLTTLTEEELELFLLRFQHRVPLREIGDRMGYSKDTASRLIAEMLQKLRTRISETFRTDDYDLARKALIQLAEDTG